MYTVFLNKIENKDNENSMDQYVGDKQNSFPLNNSNNNMPILKIQNSLEYVFYSTKGHAERVKL